MIKISTFFARHPFKACALFGCIHITTIVIYSWRTRPQDRHQSRAFYNPQSTSYRRLLRQLWK